MIHRTFVLTGPAQAKALQAFLRLNAGAKAAAGHPLAVSVAEHKAKRSEAQNNMLHALLREISEKAWLNGKQYSVEVWKEHVRRAFIGSDILDMPDGSRVTLGISTTTLNIAEFAELLDRVQAWATTELGVQFD